VLCAVGGVLASAAPAGCAAGASSDAAMAGQPQRWRSADGRVSLLRPAAAKLSTQDVPVGSLMTSGWRLIWDGTAPTPGTLEVRLALAVIAPPPQTRKTEYLQIGMSRDPVSVRTCLSGGLQGGSARRLPDRIIHGQRYTVWTHTDSGMSQTIDARDLRTVHDGACYALERFSYADSASDPDASVSLSERRGAAALDAALASVTLARPRTGARR